MADLVMWLSDIQLLPASSAIELKTAMTVMILFLMYSPPFIFLILPSIRNLRLTTLDFILINTCSII